MNRRTLRRGTWIGGALLAAIAAMTGLPATGAAADSIACQNYQVPVTVAGQNLYMHGQLCEPASDPDTIMVLVPGATYNSTYWNFPYDPSVYNFRLAMNSAGYATLTVDRLGTGASSKPPSATVTTWAQATAIHQVIQALRAGQLGGQSFTTVILGGHSLGSLDAIDEAANFHDVNGVLLTGLSNYPVATGIASFLASLYPAPLDPQLAGRGLDVGYVTTRPGTRAADFDAPDNPDPGVIATDEATKDVFSIAEEPDGVLDPIVLAESRSINVPVLLADGQDDPLFCGEQLQSNPCATAATLAASEAPFYSPAADLQTYVLPGSGHDLNLAPNTQLYQQAVLAWLAQTF
jgi:pimeloyl-ACP methyl ester carboxylesterase